MIYEIFSLITVALLWGGTNPLLKKNSKKIMVIKSASKVEQFILEIKYLFTNIGYMIPLALNQLGSVVYFFALQHTDISLAVPVANSLSFVFTAIVGSLLGEELPNRKVVMGIMFIFAGSALCCYDKYSIGTVEVLK
ncbi:hypothetical protein WA026_018434 [Henosepilachna vigintioctopunctata]|uniref:Transmembrane protein 234 homolog n=1 Tax=Henosepilachna vigintioctopunctata TaxID=420089 RepID=A0AAW1UTD0_9CUCU